MDVEVVTLFEGLFAGFLQTSFVHRAIESGALRVRFRSPRDFGLGRHRSVDDTPYGGGSGMVMRVDVMAACMESLDQERGVEAPKAHRVLLTPQGKRLTQGVVESLAARPALMLIAGRYEGFDERVRAQVDEEISLGDFVMTGGEVAAMAIIESVIRLIPGVLGNEGSAVEESHSPGNLGLLEYPQYTRPAEFRGLKVPDILTGGNHGEIAKWRRAQSISRTEERRPDLWAEIAPKLPIPRVKSKRKKDG